jgi:hypothetical protein
MAPPYDYCFRNHCPEPTIEPPFDKAQGLLIQCNNILQIGSFNE